MTTTYQSLAWNKLIGSAGVVLSAVLLTAGTISADHPMVGKPAPAPILADGAMPAPLPPQQPGVLFDVAALDDLLAPVALYPDPLLAQILPASTWPLEIVLAERWLSANPNPDDDAIDAQNWDPSVKALVRVPSVLTMMSQRLEWTEALGEAFLYQPQDVMDAIQRLRAQALAAGHLVDTPQQIVVETPQAIVIRPANPQVIYVPVYDPYVVYYAPPPVVVHYVRPAPLISFSFGFHSTRWFTSDCDWHYRTVRREVVVIHHTDSHRHTPSYVRRDDRWGSGNHWRGDDRRGGERQSTLSQARGADRRETQGQWRDSDRREIREEGNRDNRLRELGGASVSQESSPARSDDSRWREASRTDRTHAKESASGVPATLKPLPPMATPARVVTRRQVSPPSAPELPPPSRTSPEVNRRPQILTPPAVPARVQAPEVAAPRETPTIGRHRGGDSAETRPSPTPQTAQPMDSQNANRSSAAETPRITPRPGSFSGVIRQESVRTRSEASLPSPVSREAPRERISAPSQSYGREMSKRSNRR